MTVILSHLAAGACAGDGTNLGILPLLALGIRKFYNGSKPANPDAAVTNQTLLGSVTLPTPAGTQSNGVITMGAVSNSSVVADGTPTWFRQFKADGSTPLYDGNVGKVGSWKAATAYSLNEWIKAGTHYYKCTTAGTSGSSAPTWPTDGSTVGDGTGALVWTDEGIVQPFDEYFTSTTWTTDQAITTSAMSLTIPSY